MGVNRRQFLLGGLGLAAAATTMGLTGCAPGSSESGGGGGDAGTADLTFAWWGNDVRNKNTTAAIDAYSAANPGVKIAPQPGEWASYWDKLATQVAGNTAPDIIQMDMAYIAEYGNRGALLDLSEGRHLQVRRGHRRLGQDQRHAVRHQRGHQLPGRDGQPEDLREGRHGRAGRQDLDLGLDDRHGCGGRVEGEGDFGLPVAGQRELVPGAGSVSRARSCSLRDALGFDAADVQGWFDYLSKAQKAGAIGSPSQISEEFAKSLDQSAIVVGTGALALSNSNQLEAITAAAGTEITCCGTRRSRGTRPSGRRGTRRRCCGRLRPRPRILMRWSRSSTGW